MGRALKQESVGESVGAATVRLLNDLGTDVFFGIPGVHTLEFFRGIVDCRARHVLNRSELGAVHSADGYARTTGRPGVAILITGPGLTTAATAIAQAYHDSVPILIISATTPKSVRGRMLGTLHDLPDQQALMATITERSELIEDPNEIPAALRRAFEDFAGKRPRPIHIQIPIDLIDQPSPPMEMELPRVDETKVSPAEVDFVVDLATDSHKPIILAGGGCVDAGPQLGEFAAALGAPAALSLNAKGVLPDGHPLSLSTTIPTNSTIQAVADSDLVVAVGTELSEVDRYYASRPLEFGGPLVRIDLDPDQLNSGYDSAASVTGDAAHVLDALTLEMKRRRLVPAPEAESRAASLREAVRWWPQSESLMPLVEVIGKSLPEDSMVAVDSTQLAYIGQNVWRATQPRSWMIPSGFGTLGPALPLAIGSAVGNPERPSVCVTGDGGVLYSIGEMATAADLASGLVMLLFNNQGYGEMRDEFDLIDVPHIGTDAQARDYLTIARGFGWEAVRPQSLEEVAEAVVVATGKNRSTLIELTPSLVE